MDAINQNEIYHEWTSLSTEPNFIADKIVLAFISCMFCLRWCTYKQFALNKFIIKNVFTVYIFDQGYTQEVNVKGRFGKKSLHRRLFDLHFRINTPISVMALFVLCTYMNEFNRHVNISWSEVDNECDRFSMHAISDFCK